MPRWITLATVVAASICFAAWVPLAQLFQAFTPFGSALTIMAAALLVRLNRTMPTLDWKSLEPTESEKLTTAIVDLTKDYLIVLAIIAAALALVLSLVVTGADAIFGAQVFGVAGQIGGWPIGAQRVVSGVLGGFSALAIARMGYVAWRDYDIVKLQKAVIDGASAKAAQEKQRLKADGVLAVAGKANLRTIASAEPKDWDG